MTHTDSYATELLKLEQAVDKFASAMKDKLRVRLDEGYRGWDEQSSVPHLERRLRNQVAINPTFKAINIANFAMMLWIREQEKKLNQ